MKIRNGFVSNSSSSSFIIGINNSDECPTCHRKSINFIDMIEKMSNADTDTCLEARGKKEIVAYLSNEWHSDNKEIKEIKSLLDKFEKDDVALVSISYHDSFLNATIENAEENGLTIIKDYNK